jgi:3-hydroxy acid dehydrogenase / malonic semialdehyde reductase
MLAIRTLGRAIATSPSSVARGSFALHANRPLFSHLSLRRTMTTAMGKRLEGKTIVITGASSGIGRSTAMEFARTSPKNLKLVLTARRLDTLKQVAEDIKKEVGDGVKVLPVKLDVSKAAEIKAFVDRLPAEFKEIDVLVNNALVFSPVMDMTHGTDSVIHCQRTRKRSGESA